MMARERPFQCEKCENTFTLDYNLKRHIKHVHQKILDFRCENCSFKTSSRQSLNDHIKAIHDMIRDFKCEL